MVAMCCSFPVSSSFSELSTQAITVSGQAVPAPALPIGHPALNVHGFEAFYREQLGLIYRYVYRKVGNRQEAEDLTSSIFLKAVRLLQPEAGPAGRGTKRAATLGVVLSLATVLSLFTLLLFDALSRDHVLNLGFMSISVFPLLSGLLVAFTLVAAAFAISWRWAATLVSACYLVLAGIMALFVQPATDWLLTVEHLKYRQAPLFTSVVALQWFLTPLVVAILIDVIIRRARRKQWSQSKLALILSLAALLSGVLPVVLIYPPLPVVLPLQLGIAGYLASVLLGLAGAYLGTLFGRNVGESLDSLER